MQTSLNQERTGPGLVVLEQAAKQVFGRDFGVTLLPGPGLGPLQGAFSPGECSKFLGKSRAKLSRTGVFDSPSATMCSSPSPSSLA